MLIQTAYTVFIAIKPVNGTPLIKAMIIEREHHMVMKPWMVARSDLTGLHDLILATWSGKLL